MSEQLFEVSGLSFDGVISILYGDGAPGVTTVTNEAAVGSVYYDTAGKTWKKMVAGAGPSAWVPESADIGAGILSVTDVPAGVPKVLDALDITLVESAVWSVTVTSQADEERKEVFIITGSQNGVIAKHTAYSRMKFGSGITGLTYAVNLFNGNLELSVFATEIVDVECYRLSAVSKGTITVIGGGTGNGDVTSSQLATEIAARQAGDAALNTRVTTLENAPSGGGTGNANSNVHSFTNSDLVAGVLTITGTMGDFPVTQLYDENRLTIIPDEVHSANATTLAITLSSFAPIAGTWKVRVMG